MNELNNLIILGTRGIPAAHGGFETFAEQISIFLSKKGWRVRVYCQETSAAPVPIIREEDWHGVTRAVVQVPQHGSVGSLLFDWRSIRDAQHREGILLVLGYNTAMFSALVRLAGRPLVINMDGVEWKRSKWSKPVQAWFWLNERIAAWAGTTLIADHPEIKRHLETRIHTSKIKMIPYGAPLLSSAPIEPLASLGVEPNRYFVSICRIEPENSLLELVRAFSSKPRSCKLLVIGDLCDRHRYHRAVRAAAGPEVVFPGSLYDRLALNSVRFHARAYCHGHTVGGTNPSLVEALGAGNAIIAHDNPFNRWTAGEDQFFFANEHACECIFDALVDDENALRLARNRAAERFEQDFQLSAVLESYERMLLEQR